MFQSFNIFLETIYQLAAFFQTFKDVLYLPSGGYCWKCLGLTWCGCGRWCPPFISADKAWAGACARGFKGFHNYKIRKSFLLLNIIDFVECYIKTVLDWGGRGWCGDWAGFWEAGTGRGRPECPVSGGKSAVKYAPSIAVFTYWDFFGD